MYSVVEGIGEEEEGVREGAVSIVAREPRMTHQPCVSSVVTGSADEWPAEPGASTG